MKLKYVAIFVTDTTIRKFDFIRGHARIYEIDALAHISYGIESRKRKKLNKMSKSLALWPTQM